jgi:hypothetical protein
MFIGKTVIIRTNCELKYCESCGKLWLRKQGSGDSNCGACVSMWADLPGAWVERLRRKPAVEWRKLTRKAHSLSSMGWQEGGNQ